MPIKLYSKNFGEVPLINRYTGPNKEICFPGAEIYFSNSPSKNNIYLLQQFKLNYFTIRYYCFLSIKRDILAIETEQPSLTFRLGIDHSHEMITKTLGKQIFHERSYNLFFDPTPSAEYPIEPYEKFIFFDLLIEKDYSYYLHEYLPETKQLVEKKEEQKAVKFKLQNQVATTEVWRWQEELMDWCYDPNKEENFGLMIGNNLIEASIKAAKDTTEERGQPLTIKEANRIYDASEMILNSTETIPIETLAKKLGLSANKLNEGFKEIYGHSILKHRFEDKMLHALRLTNCIGASLEHVASTLGYEDASVFEKDFKKRFGFEPFEK